MSSAGRSDDMVDDTKKTDDFDESLWDDALKAASGGDENKVGLATTTARAARVSRAVIPLITNAGQADEFYPRVQDIISKMSTYAITLEYNGYNPVKFKIELINSMISRGLTKEQISDWLMRVSLLFAIRGNKAKKLEKFSEQGRALLREIQQLHPLELVKKPATASSASPARVIGAWPHFMARVFQEHKEARVIGDNEGLPRGLSFPAAASIIKPGMVRAWAAFMKWTRNFFLIVSVDKSDKKWEETERLSKTAREQTPLTLPQQAMTLALIIRGLLENKSEKPTMAKVMCIDDEDAWLRYVELSKNSSKGDVKRFDTFFDAEDVALRWSDTAKRGFLYAVEHTTA